MAAQLQGGTLSGQTEIAKRIIPTHFRGIPNQVGRRARVIEPFRVIAPSRAISARVQRLLKAAAYNGNGIQAETEPLGIVFVSAEVAPWSKTGGLGDVVGGLPVALARLGHRVMSIAPRYDQYSDLWDTSVTVNVDGEEVRFFHAIQEGVDRVFVDHPWFLAKVWGKTGGKLYGSKSGADYVDNQKRFLMFNKAAVKALEVLPFGPGTQSVIVANDWHTAILPLLVKEVYQKNGHYKDLKTALCIHNIAFQGRFWRKSWDDLNLPDRVKPFFEFVDGYPQVFVEGEAEEMIPAMAPGSTFDKLNWLRAGVLTADKLLTVSPNYATEIAEDDEKGVELSGVIRAAGGLEGIVNGIDVSEWSPFLDKHLDVKYDVNTLEEGKGVAKETLQAELGFEVNANIPIYGFIGRLEEQKGVDILVNALPEVARAGGVQIVILGTGKKLLEQQVLQLDKQFPDTVKGVVKFDVPLAHLMTAGCDFMLVPSRFEPCGLIQLHAMNYGTVPVVSSTGGLVDTVKEGVTGFHAGRFNPDKLDPKDASALAQTIRRSADVFRTPQFRTMRQRCIVQDLSWETPALKWQSVLRELWKSPNTPSVRYTEQRSSPQRAYSPAPQRGPGQEQRRSSYPTPVQEVNSEGDAVTPAAIARKSYASQAVKERSRPPSISPSGASPGPRPGPAGTRPGGPPSGGQSQQKPLAPQRPASSSGMYTGSAGPNGPTQGPGAGSQSSYRPNSGGNDESSRGSPTGSRSWDRSSGNGPEGNGASARRNPARGSPNSQ